MKTTLLMPTLNEIIGLKTTMPKISKDWFDQIIVVDGGSTDGTIEYSKSQGYYVHVQKQPGIRKAYEEVWDKIEGDIVVTYSPDGNCIPEAIPQLLEKMKHGYDMVIVSRYYMGAKSEDDDPVTAFGNRLFTGLMNLFYQAHYTDVMGIYRAYRTNLVHELDLMNDKPYALFENLFNTRISWEPLLSIRAAKYKMKIAEIPGDEPARVGGERKLRIFKWGASYMGQIFAERLF